MKKIFTIIAFATMLPHTAFADDVVFEGQCRKTNSGGCTANNVPSYAAPEGMYIEPDSISSGSVVSFNGKEPRCYKPQLDGRVNYTIPGTTAKATFFTSFKAHVQVQSGSGFNNIGQVFKIKCKYSFRLGEMPD